MNIPNKVFTNQATNASSVAVVCYGQFQTVLLQGGFGGGSVALEVSADGVTWTPLTTTAVASVINFQLADGFSVRLTLSGATAATLNAWIGYA